MPEFEARTVKEAIARGLETLGLPQDEVIIEVLDEGRSGVLGVGAKEAVVRITPIPRESEEEAPEMEQPEPVEAPVESDIIAESSPDVTSVTSATSEPASPPPSSPPIQESEEQHVLAISAEFLQGLMDRMGLKANVEGRIDEGEQEMSFYLNITGEDLGVLIGRRAETLDALQYLTRLVVNQQTHRWYHIEVDVENYKQRREKSLQRLAQTMADRAVSEGHTIVLEPMPPRERRLIHLALRDREDVYTESIGEGDARKVTIIPN